MLILLGLVTVVYIAVGLCLMNKAADYFTDSRTTVLWLVIALAWWIMIPAVCAQFGVFIFIHE